MYILKIYVLNLRIKLQYLNAHRKDIQFSWKAKN
jgi:hypothetical protein